MEVEKRPPTFLSPAVFTKTMDTFYAGKLELVNMLNSFEATLPSKPYCTDDLGRLWILPAQFAKRKKYIQYNDPWEQYWFVYDVDRSTAHFDWDDRRAPAPNITVMNPENGHAHLLYHIKTPVLTCFDNPEVHKKPIRYAAAIDVALIDKLDADRSYAELICKNPLHKYWEVTLWKKDAYDLGLLAEFLDLKPYFDGRRRLPSVGLGRNCNMFDRTRLWAYRERRNVVHKSLESFVIVCVDYAAGVNASFSAPLPFTEVKSTGRSIAKWVFRNMSPQSFTDWGDNRRAKSIIVRQEKKIERITEAKDLITREQNLNVADLANILDVSESTVKHMKLSKSGIRAKQIREYKEAHPEASKSEMAKIFNVSEKTVQRVKVLTFCKDVVLSMLVIGFGTCGLSMLIDGIMTII
jgi:predicted transcriptional regulator